MTASSTSRPVEDLRKELLAFLTQVADLKASSRKPYDVWGSAEELILGMVGEPVVVTELSLPEGVGSAPLKECFVNAYRLSVRDTRYQYAEGYAHGLVPVNHAWCVGTETGAIVEPTGVNLKMSRPTLYMGLRFDHRFMARLVASEQQPAIFEADWRRHGKVARQGLLLGPDGAVTEWGDPPPF